MAMYKCMNCMEDFNDSISSICPHCGFDKFDKIGNGKFLLPGTVLNGIYYLGNKIRDDSTGFSYIAFDNSRAKKVIIKEYFPNEICKRAAGSIRVEYNSSLNSKFEKGKSVFLKRAQDFMTKAKNIDSMAHVLDFFNENNTAYIVLEKIDGVAVSEVIETQTVPWSSFKGIIKPVVKTLSQLHRVGLTIQCLNPDNIVVTPKRRVVITDFDCLNDKKISISKSINKESDCFLPVEFYRSGSRITPSNDVYSVSAIIYRTITGFNVPRAYERAKNDELVTPSDYGIEIDKDTETALLNALDVEPNQRTENSEKLYNQLFANKKVERNTELSSGKRAKKKVAVFSAIALAIVAVIITIVAIVVKPASKPTEDESTLGTVPNLLEMNLEEARKKAKSLKKQGLNVKIVEDDEKIENAKSENDGKIASQIPKAGTKIHESDDSSLKITVRLYSYNPDAEKINDRKIEVPNVLEKTQQQANQALEKAGFINISVKDGGYSEDIDEGCVMKQSISSGEQVQADSEIVIYISKGPQPTTAAPVVTHAPSNDYRPAATSPRKTDSDTFDVKEEIFE